jgi:CheY-like chemotaxis protein
MKVLIAEDEPAFRHLLEDILVKWGYEVIGAKDGDEAWSALQAEDAAQLAILDWMMPGMDGVEVCRKIRSGTKASYTYIILLTSQQKDEDIVTGMEAGADDYIIKPLKTNELRVRLNAGVRVIDLQNKLAARAAELKVANRSLESFSKTVANDLLRSLMSIGENAKAIADLYCSKKDDQCLAYTRRIYEKTKMLGQQVGLMLDFFGPTQRELQRERIDLSQMAIEKAEEFRKARPERRVTFRITEGILVDGDKTFLKVVLHNLFDNAWKHTGRCEEAVIEFGAIEVDGKKALFVRDNGTGFEMAHVDQLFWPFQPLPGTEEFAGRGIGLATVERIIMRHGGKVWADGELGKGATFYFTLSSTDDKP